MVAFNRFNTLVNGAAQDSANAPRLFRYLTYFNCAFSAVSFGLLLIGTEAGLNTLALIGLVCIAVGALGWLGGLAWMAALFVRDARDMMNGRGSPLRRLFNRRDNHQIDPNPN